jgi:GntR family transcriptional regulator, transcriptional repressor for pyruvate dehydrogenase complex
MQVVDSLHNILALIGSAFRRAPGRKQKSIDEHREILAALVARDPEAAAAATRRHLASIEGGATEALAKAEPVSAAESRE